MPDNALSFMHDHAAIAAERHRTLTPQNQYQSIACDADRRPDPTPINIMKFCAAVARRSVKC
jgi:hypothetical protein